MIKKIKINSKTYNIEQFKECDWSSTPMGLCQPDQSKIFCDPKQELQQQADTIIHECIHVISDNFNLELDERQTRALAVSLYGIIVDNPNFINCIMEK